MRYATAIKQFLGKWTRREGEPSNPRSSLAGVTFKKTVFILPILWISALILTQNNWLISQDSKQELKKTADWINRYKEQNKHLPWSLADLRLFAKAREESFNPYDSYGLRLQYIPLNEEAFLLKSFGSDANENVLGSKPDEIILSGLDSRPAALRYKELNQSLPLFYQASFLEGLKAEKTGLTARLQVHPLILTRHLIVQDPQEVKFVLVSFHDAIEEFIWLPSGQEIVFTAQGSERYEDGIYYWDLRTGETQNILTFMRQKYWPKLASDKPFYLAISHVSTSPPMIYLLAQPANRSTLAPRSFYRFKNLFAINIDTDLSKNPSIQRIPANMDDSAFDYSLNHLSLIAPTKDGVGAQKSWQNLKLSGDAETMIDQWQNFCSQHPQSPMLPYGLWWLASIYNDTFRLMKDDAPEEALVIRNYGIEIAEALSTLRTAPRYLRAMSEHLKKSLLLSHVADYSVSSPRIEP